MLSRSAILPSPTREVGRNQGPVPPEGDGFRYALSAWRYAFLNIRLVLALRRNRAMIPQVERHPHQLIGR